MIKDAIILNPLDLSEIIESLEGYNLLLFNTEPTNDFEYNMKAYRVAVVDSLIKKLSKKFMEE